MAAALFSVMRPTYPLQCMLINERAIKDEKNLPPLLTAQDVIAIVC